MTKVFKSNADYFDWYKKKRDLIIIRNIRFTKKLKKIVILYDML